MKRMLPLACLFCILLTLAFNTAMGEKEGEAPREDKVTYAEVVQDHPALKEMVDEEGFNGLSGQEQWELIGMVDRYAFFSHEAEYYSGEAPAQGIIYLRKAKSLKKEITERFGHVLKESEPPPEKKKKRKWFF